MASLLAHEINNPLAVLTNILFLLGQQRLDSSSRELLSAGSEALNRINRIAAMTMGFFFDTDTAADVHVCDVIDEVLETLSAAERFKNIRVTREFRCNATVAAPVSRIRHLIASLLTNAMESNAATVCVRVHLGTEWRRARSGVRITIADDGRGIPRELREKIFEPFFSSKTEKGTGLGLWASRAVVLRNDGTIRVRSSVASPGRGTCVSVFLPTVAETRVVPVHSRPAAGARI
jgi:signal transduction histidine kinase